MIKLATLASLVVAVAALVSVPACSGGGSSCEAVVDHVVKISGIDVPADAKKDAVAKCEKEPAAKRECVMKAESLDDLMKCK